MFARKYHHIDLLDLYIIPRTGKYISTDEIFTKTDPLLRHKAYCNKFKINKSIRWRDFPGSPVVKNLPSNARDMDSIPDWATNISHALRKLNLSSRAHLPQVKILQDSTKQLIPDVVK